MKKILCLLLAFAILASPVLVLPANAASAAPSRQINVVYDDSGSMIRNTATKETVDTWCKAKYSMEVFAAMLGKNDTMDIYAMSDFDKSENAKPQLHLDGSEGMSANVSKVHNMVTYALNTPFNAVRKAYKDILASNADEKWLVVLTDGAFQGISDINAYFRQKDASVHVIFLGMGEEAEKNNVLSDEANNVFVEYARDNKDILSKITGICTRVFNTQRLKINASTKGISFDIPMAELTIFAQGANVKINGIKDGSGKLYSCSGQPVSVKYSEQATTNGNYPPPLIDTGLLGSIATFTDDFVAGDYLLDVSGAETIEVYYKPNIEIAAYLTDENGNEIPDLSDLEAGEYEINFGLVKGGTDESVGISKLLGEVKYEARVENNGSVHENVYHNGDKISLVEGDLTIDAVATYLGYNTTATQIKNHIFENKDLTFEVVNDSGFVVNSEGIDTSTPMQVRVKVNGNEISDEQWEGMELPEVRLASRTDFKLDDFVVERSDEKGVFNIIPTLKGGKPSSGAYTDCNLNISYEGTFGAEKWSGSSDVTMRLTDNRSWFAMYRGMIIKCGMLLLIVLFILSQILKKRLPKSLATSPQIVIMDKKKHKDYASGNFKRTHTLFRPQRGRVEFVPANVYGIPDLEIKAVSNTMFEITNIRSYCDNKDIRFDAEKITEDNASRFIAGSNLEIRVQQDGSTYICTLDVEDDS